MSASGERYGSGATSDSLQCRTVLLNTRSGSIIIDGSLTPVIADANGLQNTSSVARIARQHQYAFPIPLTALDSLGPPGALNSHRAAAWPSALVDVLFVKCR